MKTFQTSEFTQKGNEFLTKKAKIGYKPYSKFNAPKSIQIDGIGVFNFRSSFKHQVFGWEFSYSSKENNYSIIFW